jgi:hypothetical protein
MQGLPSFSAELCTSPTLNVASRHSKSTRTHTSGSVAPALPTFQTCQYQADLCAANPKKPCHMSWGCGSAVPPRNPPNPPANAADHWFQFAGCYSVCTSGRDAKGQASQDCISTFC